MAFLSHCISGFFKRWKKEGLKSTVFLCYQQVSWKLLDFHDRRLDKKICGRDLSRTVTSIYRQTMGATSSQPTRYGALDILFRDLTFSAEDSLLDVGCAKGRVLAYLLHRKFPGKLTGIELNRQVAAEAKAWTDRFPQITLLCGNVFDLNLNSFTVFYLFNPMMPDTLRRFLEKLEQELTHPATLIFLSRPDVPMDHPGWTLLRKGIIDKKWGMPLFNGRQAYAIARYTP